ncbi:hypothetical protein [Corynebacterium sp. H113]|uniref:hypothetical protein n=1 Tax=Corynebacterium sp. H113 TaxID=3133419 RepID=UPI0030AAB48F
MWHLDLGALVDGLSEWSLTDENIARLVDREDYWLNSEYSGWTTDPDDPEVKAERERRRRLGVKPPAMPILRPVAARPAHLQVQLAEAVAAQLAAAEAPPKKKISIAELAAMRGK